MSRIHLKVLILFLTLSAGGFTVCFHAAGADNTDDILHGFEEDDSTPVPSGNDMDILEGLRFFGEQLFKPLYSRRLVGDEKLKLEDLLDRHAFLVVLGRLVRQEIHTVARGETMFEAGIKLGS